MEIDTHIDWERTWFRFELSACAPGSRSRTLILGAKSWERKRKTASSRFSGFPSIEVKNKTRFFSYPRNRLTFVTYTFSSDALSVFTCPKGPNFSLTIIPYNLSSPHPYTDQKPKSQRSHTHPITCPRGRKQAASLGKPACRRGWGKNRAEKKRG